MPKLIPLEQFFCDNCGELIKNVKAGYVVWRADEDRKELDFNIIHQGGCDDKRRFPKSLPLVDFLGERGLIILTSFLSPGAIIVNAHNPKQISIPKCLNEFTDFFRRCQVPYYEEARQKFSLRGVFEEYNDHNEAAPYFRGTLQNICDTEYEN